MAIEDAKTLGLSTSEIVRPLKRAKVPQINFLLAGRFNAFFPSAETISFAMQSNEDKLSNPFDFGAMSEARQSFQGKLFRPEARAEAQAAQEAAAQPAPPPQPAPQTSPIQPSTAPVAPQMPSLFNRAAQFLRQQEEEKLLGGS